MARTSNYGRTILVLCAIGAMAIGIYGGLIRIGVPLPAGGGLEDIHGPLMICGVFGTLIGLERAVAIALAWPYLAPALAALGTVALVAGVPSAPLFVGSAAVFTAASIWIVSRQPALFTSVLLIGAACLLAGNSLWLAGASVPDVAGWWLAFLICTIAAERLELSRVIRQPPAAKWILLGFMLAIVVGGGWGLGSAGGRLLLGGGLLGTTIWLLRFDIATRTIRFDGQPRFMAAAMLSGYGWLAVTGLYLLLAGEQPFAYDLTLHAVLIGFVLSMVFGHALIIFPAIAGIRLGYSSWLYVPLALLHLSVALRVAGNLLENADARTLSGPLTAAALVIFAGMLIIPMVRRQER